MKVVVLLLACCFHQTSGVTHSLQYFYTASSEVPNFPEFVAVGMVDGVEFYHFDSNSKQAVPKQDWVNKAADPQYWERNTGNCLGSYQSFKVGIETLKGRFNQTGGVHTWQKMYGCLWDDKSEATDGFYQWGYDGEDFVSLDVKNLQIIATTSESVITKHKWENLGGWMDARKNYLTQICIGWLKKYVQYGSSTLERKVPPEVTLLQKDSGVVCHSTGFYPEGVMITWKRDGVEMQEDVDVGETLNNEDGTFQKRAVLTVSPEERKKGQYTCEVAHKSGPPIVKVLIVENGNMVGIIIGCVVAAAVVIGVIVAVVMMKKKDYKKAEQSDTESDNSK